ncbi:MAG: TIGR01777 family oxidoreductase [Pyrinomonadaceae bacterium]
MKVIISGASGLVGSALIPALLGEGHQVTRLVRRNPSAGQVNGVSTLLWDPESSTLDERSLNHEVFVHLSGETVAERWREEKKRRIRDSRVKSTALIAERLSRLVAAPPRALICASAIGFYGDRGSEVLHEESAPGSGFLAEVCREWEAAAEPARRAGIRVVHLRLGVVLSPEGGALAKMLTPFKLGVGGKVGGGDQWMSWIALDDVIEIIKFVIARDDVRGPVNVVSPHPVTNGEFTDTLGRVLSRPTFIPLPAFGARFAFGEMADALLLSSARVVPARLTEAGFAFAHPQLEEALRHLLR